ncbi:hypothetical protein JCM18899A_07090 [Nocardioides sp. AN3]
MGTLRRQVARKSLPLSQRDLDDLATLRGSVAHREALAILAGTTIGTDESEATVLHALVVAGLKAVRERVEEDAYAQVAAELDSAAKKRSARRRRPAWADEV